jgi:hypothetical protein
MQSKPEGTTEGLTVTEIHEYEADQAEHAAVMAEQAHERAHELYDQWLNAMGASNALGDAYAEAVDAVHAAAPRRADLSEQALAADEAERRIMAELREQLRTAGLTITAEGLRSKDWQTPSHNAEGARALGEAMKGRLSPDPANYNPARHAQW